MEILTVALLDETDVTVADIPVGAEPAVVPAAVVNHDTEPFCPLAIFSVVTEKVAAPPVPSVSVPLCAAMTALFGGAG